MEWFFDEMCMFLKIGIVLYEENVPNARQVKLSLQVKTSLTKQDFFNNAYLTI